MPGIAGPLHRLDDPRLAARVHLFPESVIREMTRLAARHGAVNLAQGFPDWDPPREAVDAAVEAMRSGGRNQYAVTWGAPELRQAIARWSLRDGLRPDPDANVTVTCGATEAMMAAMLALCDPGDEVIVPEPFYENYGPDAALSGARPRFVPLYPERGYRFDEEEMKAAFGPKTKALILNTPSNPCGHVMRRDELSLLADLCTDHDAFAVTDEIYNFLTYDGHKHVSMATLPGMDERTITIQGASKVFSATGWRVAWLLAPPTVSVALRRVHDFLTVGAPHPLQLGVAAALALPDSYYEELRARYDAQRHLLVGLLRKAGFRVDPPEGAYYVLCDFRDVAAPAAAKEDDRSFAEWLVREIGLAGVPGSSFFSRAELGRSLVRFHFAKSEATLRAAQARLAKLG
ncbi:MAG TPA: aminotransferase class I/II-fold pyridoxal phosphate-dependent enzyme [Candidatus Thermoplasmatota archaeon]|nr:aminotransferase class I/II-fold pyridoxal phosphate-dependent enzyme [Candidatus Thermoplasmatota archaeon]